MVCSAVVNVQFHLRFFKYVQFLKLILSDEEVLFKDI